MRLIDADALKQDLTRFYDNEVTAKRLIDEQPTKEPCNTDTCKVVKAYMNEWDKPNNSDAISRQVVLDLIEHYNSDGLGSVFYGYEEGVKFADAVNKLPPVNPQEPTEWQQDHEILKAYSDGANEVLEKIRAEIESLQNANPSYWHSGDMVDREEVLEIIDKYKEDT